MGRFFNMSAFAAVSVKFFPVLLSVFMCEAVNDVKKLKYI